MSSESKIWAKNKELNTFLAEFDDRFARSESRERLRNYIGGQVSDLPRKSIEPIALAAGVVPRTLQCFLASAKWDECRMRDRTQWIVARDHANRQAIGAVDGTGSSLTGLMSWGKVILARFPRTLAAGFTSRRYCIAPGLKKPINAGENGGIRDWRGRLSQPAK